MTPHKDNKKRLIIKEEKLSDELKKLVLTVYPEGLEGYLQKVVKPSGEVMFVYPLETEDTIYMVRHNFKIDAPGTEVVIESNDEEEDGPQESENESELNNIIRNDNGEGARVHETETTINYCSYETPNEASMGKPKKKQMTAADIEEMVKQEIARENGTDDEEEDDKEDIFDDDEPTDDELRDIEREVEEEQAKAAKTVKKSATKGAKSDSKSTKSTTKEKKSTTRTKKEK